MTFAIVLLAFGGFLLGGAWSVWRIEPDATGPAAPQPKGRAPATPPRRAAPRARGRSAPQLVLAIVLLLAALLSTASGILRLI